MKWHCHRPIHLKNFSLNPWIAYNVFNLETQFYRKTTPHFRCFFLAGIKIIGAMKLPFGCNRSQPNPANLLAHNVFRKMVNSNFGPITKMSGPFKKIDYFSLTARSQQKRTMLVSISTYFCPNFDLTIFRKKNHQPICSVLVGTYHNQRATS